MRPVAGAGAVLQAAAALLWVAQAALLALAVQRLADGQGVAGVLLPAAGVALLGVVRASAEAWGAQRVYVQARDTVTGLRARVARALAGRSPLERERPASGLAASALGEQAEAVVPWLARYQPARWRAMVVPPVIALVVLGLSWVAALILVLSMPLIPLAMAIVGWRAQAASEEQMVALGDMNAQLLDRLRGLSTLRALDAVDATALRLRAAAESLRQRTMRVLRIAFLSSASLELFSALAVALVAVYVGFHLLGQIGTAGTWGARLSLGEGLFILLLAPAFFEPLRDLAAAWHDRAAGEAALASLEALGRPGQGLPGALAESAGEALPAGATPVTRPPEVLMRAVVFAHPGEAPVFDGLDLRIAPGEHVAIMGPSGAGKTSLLALLAGLVVPAQGEVVIAGRPMDAAQAAALRGRMAWIGQRPHVFAGTVRDNIALGRAGVGREAVARALRLAALDAVAQASPDGGLGEGGLGLSGGERVRLALARAMARPGADLLLADEPTAHLDPVTAEQVAEALLAHARGRTLLIATHDAALAQRMDRIIDITSGQAVTVPVPGAWPLGQRRLA
ncbi:MAG: thiol reductant ABC exporter subunit CydD [Hydrogenophaga sp.]|jgi:ATP-binding cassette subfamily C protein CydD|uniref:thiol reductant ABC exporter subunit CydD n=1 Tax=Hydrogenophaga sp. TaxID=1904254 RepID=UPI00260FA669|nr:thiol reductant ABC exporter subunit CydD [Hydrogenophaga sp.]MDD3786270.1 thiol reductant ABC exporter subunit CydD [Hydrogenophaga sp.]MDX9969349.1 thiol reductant ABC exporter subunit CydD [Hydrogenophaga sp.]